MNSKITLTLINFTDGLIFKLKLSLNKQSKRIQKIHFYFKDQINTDYNKS